MSTKPVEILLPVQCSAIFWPLLKLNDYIEVKDVFARYLDTILLLLLSLPLLLSTAIIRWIEKEAM